MLINNQFDLEQIVFLRTDIEQLPRIITRFSVSSTGVLYYLSCSTNESSHYAFEISTERNKSLLMDIHASSGGVEI